MNQDLRKIKWTSKTEYVDVETGEVITKSLAEREYIKKRSTKFTIIQNNNGTIKWITECERNRQQKLF